MQVARQGSLAEQQLHQQQLQALHDDLQAVRVSVSRANDVVYYLPHSRASPIVNQPLQCKSGVLGCCLVTCVVQCHDGKLLLVRHFCQGGCVVMMPADPLLFIFQCCCNSQVMLGAAHRMTNVHEVAHTYHMLPLPHNAVLFAKKRESRQIHPYICGGLSSSWCVFTGVHGWSVMLDDVEGGIVLTLAAVLYRSNTTLMLRHGAVSRQHCRQI